MTGEAIVAAYVFILAIFVGFEVVSKVPSTLHTPLMSGANAIHGIVIVGAMLVASAIGGTVGTILGFLAVVLGTANVVGGFVVTDRMLAMFKQRPVRKRERPSRRSSRSRTSSRRLPSSSDSRDSRRPPPRCRATASRRPACSSRSSRPSSQLT
jgi:NAD(P) transhydrogenase subunit alpha